MILVGDCVELMRELDEASVDAIVTDPPYGLEFMGKEWDCLGRNSPPSFEHSMQDGFKGFQPLPRPGGLTLEGMHAAQDWHHAWATEALRVLRPGGHLLAFGGTRTYHRLACAIEDAGFEIRDCLAWMFGSGFPKSLDVSKAIDKAAGEKRDTPISFREDGLPSSGRLSTPSHADGLATSTAWCQQCGRTHGGSPSNCQCDRHGEPITDDARTWQGWGTALKPAHEPIVVARKPLAGTVAANVLEHGTGALNVDGCRIEAPAGDRKTYGLNGDEAAGIGYHGLEGRTAYERPAAGRWPANVLLDETSAAMLDEQTGIQKSHGRSWTGSGGDVYGGGSGYTAGMARQESEIMDSGGASRFFQRIDQEVENAEARESSSEPRLPCGSGGGVGGKDEDRKDVPSVRMLDEGGERFRYVAKASRAERNAGLEGFEERDASERHAYVGLPDQRMEREQIRNGARNHHPTVKPVALMRWLVRLVTPPGGKVLDPFTGSGTTGIAAALEGFDFLGMEQDAEYARIAEARIAFWTEHGEEGLRIVAERERAEAEREQIAASGQMELL